MAYSTTQDAEDILGRPLSEAEATALEIYLEIIEALIDEWIIDSGRNPIEVPEEKKKLVSTLMSEQASYAFGVDPTLVSSSLTSGDSSSSSTRSGASADRFLKPTPLYFTILGIKRVSIASAPIKTSWR